jgi:hypothetical protein
MPNDLPDCNPRFQLSFYLVESLWEVGLATLGSGAQKGPRMLQKTLKP